MTESLGASTGRTLRVNRCSQERCQCTRRSRVKMLSGGMEPGEGSGWGKLVKRTVSLRTTLSHPRQMPQRGQSFHCTGTRGSGAGVSVGVGGAAEREEESGHNTALTKPRLETLPPFLTLRTQRTGTTMANARGIQNPQGAITLGAPFLWIERAISGSTQCPIRLRDKIREQQVVNLGFEHSRN